MLRLPKFIKLIVPAVLGIMLILAGMRMFVSADMASVVKGQLKFLKEGEASLAYNLNSKGFKDEVSLEEFELFLKQYAFLTNYVSYSLSGRSLNKNKGSLKVIFVTGDGIKTPVIYRLYKKGPKWKIDNILPVVSKQTQRPAERPIQRPVERPIESPIQRPVKVAPPIIDPHSGSVEYFCDAGEEAFKNGDLTGALSYFNASLQKNSAYARAYVGRGYTYSWQGDYDSAIADYWEAMSLIQDAAWLVKLRHYLCDILIITNRLTEADSVLNALLAQQQPDAWSYTLAGQYYLQKGSLNAAKKYFAGAVRLNPQEGNLRYDEAGKWVDRRQYIRALLLYDAAEIMNPQISGVHFGRGNAYAGLGQNQEATVAYERYLQFDSTSEWAQRARERIAKLKVR